MSTLQEVVTQHASRAHAWSSTLLNRLLAAPSSDSDAVMVRPASLDNRSCTCFLPRVLRALHEAARSGGRRMVGRRLLALGRRSGANILSWLAKPRTCTVSAGAKKV